MTESGCATSGHIILEAAVERARTCAYLRDSTAVSRIINYTKLDGGITFHAENVTDISCAISPGAWIYCRGDALLLFASDLTGNDDHLWVLIATHLKGNASSNDYTALDCDWDKLAYNSQVISFNSAGNNGNNSGNIFSLDREFNVNTVGSYNDRH